MLHGRDRERAAIDRVLAESAIGRGGALLLRGEPGAGKSCLLVEARARAEGFTVLQTVGIEAESELPYAGLHQLVWPLLSRIDSLQPPQAAALRSALGLEAGGEPDRFLVSVALLTLLSEAAEERPILALVDDARWLDQPTADALVFVARRLAGERIAMLAADRDSAPSPFDVPDVPELPVTGLDAAAVAAMLDELTASRVDRRVATQLAERTHGNPLVLTEMLELLTPGQLSGAAALSDPLPVGDDVEEFIAERVERLPEGTRRLLLLAAAADSTDLGPILAAGRSLGVPADALPPAEAARLVRAHGSEIEFRHPVVRSAVYHAASTLERHEAHRALADVVDDDAEPGRRAWHRAAATVEPDESVARELEQAAERASRRGALAAAASALRRAAALTPDASRRGRRLAAAGRAAFLSGQPEAAAALLKEADPLLHDPVDRAQAAMTLGEVHLTKAAAAAAIEVFTRAADEVAATHPEQALDLLVPAATMITECLCGDEQRVVRRVDALPGEGGDPMAVAYVRSSARLARTSLADAGRLDAFIPRERAERVPTRRYWIGVTTTHPVAAVPLSEAIAFLDRLAVLCRSQGLAGQLGAVLVSLAYGQLQAGRCPAAAADATEALGLSRDAGQELIVRLASGILAVIAGIQGRMEDCRSFANDARDQSGGDARWCHHALSFWALGMGALGADDPDAALSHFMEIRPGGAFEQPWVTPLAVADIVEAAMRAGREDIAVGATADLEAWSRRSGVEWSAAAVARCAALVEEDPDRAAELYEEALARYEGLDRLYDRARTRLLYGELLRRSRRRVEAREQLRRALHAFELKGAEPWAERARRELRASGQTLRRSDEGARDLLTPQELQIARFVARGGTNKEVAAQLFLSPRTVSSHLQSIFRKLGVATRTELAQYEFEGEDDQDEAAAV
jgi:DNA-binding CsgD family transcriptional regulator